MGMTGDGEGRISRREGEKMSLSIGGQIKSWISKERESSLET
jgi:hypothetical protein